MVAINDSVNSSSTATMVPPSEQPLTDEQLQGKAAFDKIYASNQPATSQTAAVPASDAQLQAGIQSRGLAIEGLDNPEDQHRWPGGIVPYTIDPALSEAEQQEIREGIEMIESQTNVTFVELQDADNNGIPDG